MDNVNAKEKNPTLYGNEMRVKEEKSIGSCSGHTDGQLIKPHVVPWVDGVTVMLLFSQDRSRPLEFVPALLCGIRKDRDST